MYTGILHTHTLSVVLFLVLYIVKTFLLVSNNQKALDKLTQVTKWPERIISVLFLVTGIFLLVNSGNISWMIYVKIGMVFASIPLAIIGFKRKKSVLAILSVLLLIGSYGLAEMNKKAISKKSKPSIQESAGALEVGKSLYSTYCVACHGDNGDAGLSGAKNLRTSALSPEEKMSIIKNGKSSMPGFSQLSDDEVKSILLYTDTFLEK